MKGCQKFEKILFSTVLLLNYALKVIGGPKIEVDPSVPQGSGGLSSSM